MYNYFKFCSFALALPLVSCGGGGGGGDSSSGNSPTYNVQQKMLIQVNSTSNWITLYPDRRLGTDTCEVESQPTHGSLVVNAGGSLNNVNCTFNYIPASGYIGNDLFRVKLTTKSSNGSGSPEITYFSMNVKTRYFNTSLANLIASPLIDVTKFLTANSSYPYNPKEYNLGATAIGDFNGNGYNDLAISSKSDRWADYKVSIFYGGLKLNDLYDLRAVNNQSSTESLSFNWKITDQFKELNYIKSLGDYNKDGKNDILLGGSGSVIIFGGANQTDFQEQIESNKSPLLGLEKYRFSPENPSSFHVTNNPLGDINGDGNTDFIVGWNETDYSARISDIYIVSGGANQTALPDITQNNKLNKIQLQTDNVVTQTGSGDVNGDGINDILVGHMPKSLDIQAAEDSRSVLLLGSPQLSNNISLDIGIASVPNGTVFTQSEDSGFWLGSCASIINDMNGDGYDEISLASNTNHVVDGYYIYVAYGSANMPSSFDVDDIDRRYTQVITKGFSIKNKNICNAISLGDLNGDGYKDIAATQAFSDYLIPPKVYLIFGGNNMPSEIDLSKVSENVVAIDVPEFLSIAPAGDMNQDGKDDLVISTTDSSGSVFLIYGSEHFFPE